MNFSRRFFVRISLMSVVVVLVGTALVIWHMHNADRFFRATINIQTPTEFMIKPGEGALQVVSRMAKEGKISVQVPYALSYHLALRKLDLPIQLGAYILLPSMSVHDVLQLFAQGKTLQRRWSLVEGLTVVDFLQSLYHAQDIQYDLPEVRSRADYPRLLQKLAIDFPSPEGLFLSETYFYSPGATASSILYRAHIALHNALDENEAACASLAHRTSIRLDRYEQMVLASIIEKETGVASERPQIASVFYNRLQRGMRLQTDPTVIYGLDERYTGNIKRSHLRETTPWNTYVIDGLPPTPISSFGRAALDSVCNPNAQAMQNPALLYFVGKGDGTHEFSSNLQSHNKAVRRYQLQRKSDYRSSPVLQ